MAVLQAGGAIVVIHVGVHAVHRAGGGDHPVQQACRRHSRLEGRAGGVQAVEGPVQQRAGVLRRQVAVGGAVLVQVIGGIGGRGQNAAGLYVQHHHGTGVGLLTAVGGLGLLQGENAVLQGGLHLFLEIRIHGEHHGLAGLRLFHHLAGLDHPVRILHHLQRAVLAAQPILIHGFQAAAADQVVHGVALAAQGVIIRHPLLPQNLAHRAQHMGQHGAVRVAAHGGLHNLRAAQAQAALLHGGHGAVADAGGQGKVGVVGIVLAGHLAANSAQNALPGRFIVLQFILGHNGAHHLVSGGILLQTQVGFDGGQAVLVRGIVPIGKAVMAVRVRAADGSGVVPGVP